jgi:hypothetical protein
MVGLGTRSTIERVEIGNSRPKVARASALPDRRRRAERAVGRHTRETLGSPIVSPDPHCTAVGVAEALLEEPYALIAHVRVCGGAGWVTIGSTRHLTASSVRSCLALSKPSFHSGARLTPE